MSTGSDQASIEDSQRCAWCHGDDLYRAYHDTEWGVPVSGAQELFERLTLEGMQAGLAWITILRKRETMNAAFYGFSIRKLAACTEADVVEWLANTGVIRHRGKLSAMIGNAQLALADDDFSEMLWQFAPRKNVKHRTLKTVPSQTDESVAMSKALKNKGYRFVGPTICYAFMQSVGMVNDHPEYCWRRQVCDDLLAQRS